MQGGFGIAQQFVTGQAIVRVQADADAGAQIGFAAIAHLQRALQQLQQGAGDTRRFLGPLQVFQDDEEFVAVQPRQRVLVAQALLQAPRHGDQQFVTNLVAKPLVDGLEMVEIEEQHRHPFAVPVRVFDGMVEAFVGKQAVRQVGQGVEVHQMGQALLAVTVLAEIGEGQYVLGLKRVAAAHPADREPEREARTILATAVQLALPMPAFLDLAPQGAIARTFNAVAR